MRNSLGTLAAVAAIAAAGSMQASAAVTPTFVQNLPINLIGDTDIDINGDNGVDFSLNWQGAFINAMSGSDMVVDFGYMLRPLGIGDVVDGSSGYNGYAEFGHLVGGSNIFAGFSFTIAGEIHYGWLAFDFSTDAPMIVGGAWESIAGQGIEIQAVPEPSFYAALGGLLAVAAIGVRRSLRRSRR